MSDDQLLKEVIADSVHRQSRDLLWNFYGRVRGINGDKAKVALWRTPAGSAMSNLARSQFGRLPAGKAMTAIQRSKEAQTEHAAALRALDEGIPRDQIDLDNWR